jgi:hypothetical protein
MIVFQGTSYQEANPAAHGGDELVPRNEWKAWSQAVQFSTTPSDWLVVRGAETGDDTTVMREVCRRIVGSRHFAGRSFSAADDFIYRTAEAQGVRAIQPTGAGSIPATTSPGSCATSAP